MAGFKRKQRDSLLQKLISIVAVTLVMAAFTANAESFLLLHKTGDNSLVEEAVRHTAKKPIDICLDKNGDLVIKRSGVLLTLSNTPTDEIIERLRTTQRQDCRSINDISLKITFIF